MIITDSPSPNFGSRPSGARPVLTVIHGTAGSDKGDLMWLRSKASQLSYHYLIWRNGSVHRLVRPEKRAWHAGKSSWRGITDANDHAIGIALSNRGPDPDSGLALEQYTAAQYEAAGELCAIFEREYGIGMEQIVGHVHVSPGRKTDPWPWFHWGALFSAMDRHRKP